MAGGSGSGVSECSIGDIVKTNPFLVALLSTTKTEPVKNSFNGNGNGNGNGSNVFLNHRNPSSFHKQKRNENTDSVKMNYFIHNTSIQNDRRNSSVLNNNTCDVPTIINTNDTEQFPVLGVSGKQSSNNNNKVLNFKDIIMKQTTLDVIGTAPVPVPVPVPVVAAARSVPPVRPLTRGNIFLGAFYKTDDDGDDGDGHGDGHSDSDGHSDGHGHGRIITSALVDSCDRAYDKLYK